MLASTSAEAGRLPPARSGVQLLRECARATLDAPGARRIRGLLDDGPDWPCVLAGAEGHGLTSLLAHHLGGLEGVPAWTQAELQDRLRQNTRKNLAMASELVRLLSHLRDRGVTALPFKGPVLAAAAYGHLGLREFSDLDLLVRTEDVATACRALVADGYRPLLDLTPAQEAAHLRSRYEHPFQRDDGGPVVEIQWRIVPAHFGVRLDYGRFWERRERVSLAGRLVPSLAAEDLLLTLAVHGAKHLWERLGWVADVAELVRARPGLDWARLWTQAEESGCRRMLAMALCLASGLPGSAVPAAEVARAAEDPRVRPLVAEVEDRMFAGEPPASVWRQGLFHVRAHERSGDRWRYLARLGLATTPGDWAVVRLPRPLFPLYRLIRVVRIALKYGGHATRSLVAGAGPRP